MRVFLARHGQTDWNVEHRLQGRSDTQLTALGQVQARALAATLADQPIDAVYSSPLRRAMDTAWPLAQERGLEIHATPAMLEMSYGVLEGHTVRSGDVEIRRLLAARRQDPLHFRAPGGETYTDVAARVRPFAEELAARHAGQTILVVGHRGSNRVLAAILLVRPLAELLRLKQKNDCVLEVSQTAGLVVRPYVQLASGGNA